MSTRRTARPVAAAMLALAVTGCAAEQDAGLRPGPAESSSSAGDDGPDRSTTATLELTVEDPSGGGRCMVPTAEALSPATTAFEGSVVALENGVATLEVDQWYTGGEADRVLVAAPDADLQALLSAVRFDLGKTYLVSATGDALLLCGFTAEKTPELEATYDEAFGS